VIEGASPKGGRLERGYMFLIASSLCTVYVASKFCYSNPILPLFCWRRLFLWGTMYMYLTASSHTALLYSTRFQSLTTVWPLNRFWQLWLMYMYMPFFS